jgi:hypothetical protein
MTAFIHRLPASEHPWVFAVEFDYNVEMVDAIKQHIPSRQRSWKPNVKQWWFRAEVIVAVCALADKHCGRYVHVEELYTPTDETPASAYAMLHLLPTAPPEVVNAAYRALAKRVHPDAGGDTAKMQEINAAYKLLQDNYA